MAELPVPTGSLGDAVRVICHASDHDRDVVLEAVEQLRHLTLSNVDCGSACLPGFESEQLTATFSKKRVTS